MPCAADACAFGLGRGRFVDEFAQLTVHRVALTSMAFPRTEGEPTLFPVVAVWADLTPLLDAGLVLANDGISVPGLRTIDAFRLPDRARIGLVLSPKATAAELADADLDEDLDEDLDGLAPDSASDPAEDEQPLTVAEVLDPFYPRFNLILPTTTVALVTALSSMPVGFRLVLLHGEPPASPESLVLGVPDVAACVLLAEETTFAALEGQVPDLLAAPLPYEIESDDEDELTVHDSMRALVWSTIAGTALGEQVSYRRLLGFGQWAHDLATRPEIDTERLAGVLNNAATIQMLSMDAVVEEDATVDLTVLPAAMAALQASITADVSAAALNDLAQGLPFPDVAQAYGLHQTLPALGVLVAARAHAVVAEQANGVTVSWLVATWLDGESEYPLWTFPSCAPALAHHDVAVIGDLLATQPQGFAAEEHGPLLGRYLHMLAEAVGLMDMDEATLESGLRGLDVTPQNLPDLIALATTMMWDGYAAAERADGTCPACAAIEGVMGGWEPQRLARAAATLLPCLADLDAADQGHPVGDEAWVAYRTEFLRDWLHEAA